MDERETSAVEVVLAYHERTKHHADRYARSLGYLDWASQPDPFRTYDGAPQLKLERVPPSPEPAWDALFRDPPAPVRLDGRSLAQFLHESLALSAWKEAGTARWALRVNPSSGNLHPTEAHLLLPAIPGFSQTPLLAHYACLSHAIEARADLSKVWPALGSTLAEGSFLVGLSSIHVRESWKYGERAFRYCQHDVGHAIAALAFSAATLGWQVQLVDGTTGEELAQWMGLSDQQGFEAEHPDCLVIVSPRGAAPARPNLSAFADMRALPLLGTPNRLSDEHHPWPIIDDVANASKRLAPPRAARPVDGLLPVEPFPKRGVSARPIIRQRRSAVAMDGATTISAETFYRMLWRTLPSSKHPLFSALPWTPGLHLAIFVHRVDGLEPGIYVLMRHDSDVADFRARIHPAFSWESVDGAPAGLPLFRLAAADMRDTAKTVSCNQDIAADGAFSLGMIASFATRLAHEGASIYPRLFWESGAIGQQLYLEAEAAGVRATGIGCFFDDLMHDVLGFKDNRFQSLYHFTIGGPVDDSRLRTLAAYEP